MSAVEVALVTMMMMIMLGIARDLGAALDSLDTLDEMLSCRQGQEGTEMGCKPP